MANLINLHILLNIAGILLTFIGYSVFAGYVIHNKRKGFLQHIILGFILAAICFVIGSVLSLIHGVDHLVEALVLQSYDYSKFIPFGYGFLFSTLMLIIISPFHLLIKRFIKKEMKI